MRVKYSQRIRHISEGKVYCTLSSNNETGYAVWDTGACCQESDAHDDIRDSQSVANYSHLKAHRLSELTNGLRSVPGSKCQPSYQISNFKYSLT